MLLDVFGIIGSYLFVFGLIGFASLLMRRQALGPSATRKVIHIGVAHWWLIAMATIDDPWVASIGPVSFIIINVLSVRLQALPAMDQAAGARNWGTVYFPVSLLVLVNLCWRGILPVWVGGLAVLVMGWGDGLAALVGERKGARGFRVWRGRKSIAGTAVMFGASFVVILVFTLIFNARFTALLPAVGVSAAVAGAATVVELLTPLGIDNITVPLLTAALYGLAFA